MKTSNYKTTPARTGDIGKLGEGVDADWAEANGGRALRRLLARHQRKQASKAGAVNAGNNTKKDGGK
jgi:hypothetical protein